MGARRAAEEVAEPRPTVREAMHFGVFATARLVAGEAGLDRRIEWVRTMETPEVQPRAGDLMLTTGFPIKDDRAAQIRLVDRIAASGGAGLVVRPHPYLRKLPPEMLAEADRLSVPLFTVGADVAFIDLMAPLLERIINAEHWRLKRSLDIHRRFTELVLDGKGVNEICRTLGELLESAVVIEDASFHLLAHAGGTGDPHRKETIQRQGTPHRVPFDPQIHRMLREVEANRVPPRRHVARAADRADLCRQPGPGLHLRARPSAPQRGARIPRHGAGRPGPGARHRQGEGAGRGRGKGPRRVPRGPAAWHLRGRGGGAAQGASPGLPAPRQPHPDA